jgi:hypothetical protein
MPISALTEKIAWLTTMVSLIAVALFALSWAIGSLLKGAPNHLENGRNMETIS